MIDCRQPQEESSAAPSLTLREYRDLACGCSCVILLLMMMMNDNLSWRISPYEASWRLGSEHRRSSTAIRTHILSLSSTRVCVFLVAAIWSSSEAALTLSGLACIFIIFFLLLLCDSLSRRIWPYGASWRLGFGHCRSSGTIPADILSLEHQSISGSLFQRERERYLHHIRVVYG